MVILVFVRGGEEDVQTLEGWYRAPVSIARLPVAQGHEAEGHEGHIALAAVEGDGGGTGRKRESDSGDLLSSGRCGPVLGGRRKNENKHHRKCRVIHAR